MRLLKAAFMLIIMVDALIILLALIFLHPLLILIFIALSAVLKGLYNQFNKRKLYKTRPLGKNQLFINH